MVEDKGLPVHKKLLLGVEILREYVRARTLLRTVDLPTAVARLRAQASASTQPAELRAALRLGHAVTRTLEPLPSDTRCLTRSLVLVSMLARRHTSSQVVIGVRPGSDFTAHAWVELDGVPLLPTGADEFSRLTEI